VSRTRAADPTLLASSRRVGAFRVRRIVRAGTCAGAASRRAAHDGS